jgi:hypothetical protein
MISLLAQCSLFTEILLFRTLKLNPVIYAIGLKFTGPRDGNHVVGKLPEYLNGKHFGLALIRFVLYQFYHCHVTQPPLLEQLYEMGVDISSGYLNNLLIKPEKIWTMSKSNFGICMMI